MQPAQERAGRLSSTALASPKRCEAHDQRRRSKHKRTHSGEQAKRNRPRETGQEEQAKRDKCLGRPGAGRSASSKGGGERTPIRAGAQRRKTGTRVGRKGRG